MPPKSSSDPKLLEAIGSLLLARNGPLLPEEIKQINEIDPLLLEKRKIAQFFAVALCKIKLAEMKKAHAYLLDIYNQQVIFINLDTKFDCSFIREKISKSEVLLKVKETLQNLGITVQVGIGHEEYSYPHSILITGTDREEFLKHVNKFDELVKENAYQAECYIWFLNIDKKITQLKANLQQEIKQAKESKLVFFRKNQIKVKLIKYAFLEKLSERINRPISSDFSMNDIVKEVLGALAKDYGHDAINKVFEGMRSRVEKLTIEFLGKDGKQELASIIREEQGKLPLAAQFSS